MYSLTKVRSPFLNSKLKALLHRYLSSQGQPVLEIDKIKNPKHKSVGAHIFTKTQAEHFKECYYNTGDLDLDLIKSVKITRKIEKRAMNLIKDAGVTVLESVFKKYGHSVRLVGGTVRDIFMGLKPKDMDIATTATPEEMKIIFSKEDIVIATDKGNSTGMIIASIYGCNYECCTLRKSLGNSPTTKLQFSTDWKCDAEIRDLTINAMSLDFDGTVYDYCNSIEHLEQGHITFVGDASKRIQDDPLRIFRYFRFFCRLSKSGKHEEKAIEAIKENVSCLSSVPVERIWVELRKILSSKLAPQIIDKMKECGMFPYMGLGENYDIENFKNIYQRCKASTNSVLALITAGFSSEQDVLLFKEKMKCSNMELFTINYIINYRNQNFSDEEIVSMLIDLKYEHHYNSANRKGIFCNLLAYNGCSRNQLPVLPIFPVNSYILYHVGIRGKLVIREKLKELLHIWKNSKYTMSKDELLNSI